MNPLELRTKIFNLLSRENRTDTSMRADIDLESPVPGRPVALTVETTDPFGQPRRYRVTVEEV